MEFLQFYRVDFVLYIKDSTLNMLMYVYMFCTSTLKDNNKGERPFYSN